MCAKKDLKKRAKSGPQKARQKLTSKSAPNHSKTDIQDQRFMGVYGFTQICGFYHRKFTAVIKCLEKRK
jgi:hypothetical protein